MKGLLEYMIIELRILAQPFRQLYEKYKSWVVISWLKSIWGKCYKVDILINFGNVPIELLRGGNQWLVKILKSSGYSWADLNILTRVRVHQQVLFLLDELGASGKVLGTRYLQRRSLEERWSCLGFPKKGLLTVTSSSGQQPCEA
jgi:hypothetical protein